MSSRSALPYFGSQLSVLNIPPLQSSGSVLHQSTALGPHVVHEGITPCTGQFVPFFFLVHHLSLIAQSLGQRQGERHRGRKGLLHSFAELKKKKKKTITFKSVGGPGLYNGERKLLADDICWECFHIGGVK